MCGRFALNSSFAEIQKNLDIKNSIVFKRRFNISPGENVLIVKNWGELSFAQWGFCPEWMKKQPKAIINSRAETILEKVAFKKAIKSSRCLILSTGYYEWLKERNFKQPYFIKLKNDDLFCFAGIWENDTCSIITKESSENIKKIHVRQPLILTKEHYKDWLQGDEFKKILVEDDNHYKLLSYKVSTSVNNPSFDNVNCLEEIS